jgi:hypothetical protein
MSIQFLVGVYFATIFPVMTGSEVNSSILMKELAATGI